MGSLCATLSVIGRVYEKFREINPNVGLNPKSFSFKIVWC